MQITLESLVWVGCFCMVMALIEAWSLSSVFYLKLGFMKKLFPNTPYLLKSHIDFLLMTLFLFVFYLMFSHFNISPPTFILWAICIGSIANPMGFFALAIKPTLPQTPTSLFGILMTGSFIFTTIGYLGSIVLIGRAVAK